MVGRRHTWTGGVGDQLLRVPDLAIVTCGETIEAAKRAACEAIRINLVAYQEAGQKVTEGQTALKHLENPEFQDLLFTYVVVDMPYPLAVIAAQSADLGVSDLAEHHDDYAHRR